jgi:UDP-GlcNAc:undecaprenyl-phosphate GlcNAc-1-phosphate transferase
MSSLSVAAVACGLTILFVWIMRPLAVRVGLTDQPNSRKVHEGEIPLVGGLAIFAALGATGWVFDFSREFAALLTGGGILVALGALDDRWELSPTVRLVGQIGAALVMCLGGGLVVNDLGALLPYGQPLELGIFGVPFTVFATVALINSVNMSDGIDGLAGSQSLLSLAGLGVAMALTGAASSGVLPLFALCGCLCAFLAFNLRAPWRRKAGVFLGDAGSNLLGFALAWFLVQASQGDGATLPAPAVLWFVALQVFDTVEIVVRRVLRGRSPFGADREHLHHVFLLAGFSVSETVCSMAAFTVAGIAIGLFATAYRLADPAVLFAFMLCGTLFLGVILRTWRIMRFLHRSICRRKQPVDRRRQQVSWFGAERRSGMDRRRIAAAAAAQRELAAGRDVNSAQGVLIRKSERAT